MDLFYGKDVLDIGCNIGHVTFSVARDFGAKSVVGMDIDRKLINIARKNVQHYINDTAQSSPTTQTHPTQSSSHLSSNYHFKEFSSRNHNDPNRDIIHNFPETHIAFVINLNLWNYHILFASLTCTKETL